MHGYGRRVQYLLARNGTILALVALIVVFSLQTGSFLTWTNAKNVGQAVAELGVISIPLALLVISGAVDLSVGSIASMAGILAGKVMLSTGSTTLGALAGLGFGIGAGALNGILVSYGKLNTIVVTLGGLSLWGGMALDLTGGQTLSGFPNSFTNFALTTVAGIPIEIFVLLAVIVVCWTVLRFAPFGRRLYAVGGNERASFLMGVPVRRVRFFMFVGVGAAASIAGMMLASKLAAATPISGQGLEITALTVVLLGGVAFQGGMGRLSGVVAGLFFVGVLQNGLVITGTSQFLQQVFLGVVLIAAIALDNTIRRFAHSAWTEAKPTAEGEQGPAVPKPDVAEAVADR